MTVDVLGEIATNPPQVPGKAAEYIKVLQAIHAQGLNAGVSIKPAALGLLLDLPQCEHFFADILEVVQRYQLPVCTHMKDVAYTQMEIDLFTRLRQGGKHLSLAIQACLQRSYGDIEQSSPMKSRLRICKGIYVEDHPHLRADSWQSRCAVDSHLLHHLNRCFDERVFVEIAFHDEALIEQVIALAGRRAIAPAQFKFQMLLGVCETSRDRLLMRGFSARIYLPCSDNWYAYSIR